MLLQHYRGKLLEEQHYYPHGLTIRGGANTPLPNKYLHQSKELQDEHNLDLYDFHARLYDPQIGRFWGIDPMDQFPSGYTGMGNDPANLVDPTGMLAGGAAGYATAQEGEPSGTYDEFWGWFDGMKTGAVSNGGGGSGGTSHNTGTGGGLTSVGIAPTPTMGEYMAYNRVWMASQGTGALAFNGSAPNDDNYMLNVDGSVSLIQRTGSLSHGFFNSKGQFLFKIEQVLTEFNVPVALQQEAAWSVTKVGLFLYNHPILQEEMIARGMATGWDANAGVMELVRLGRNSQEMLRMDLLAGGVIPMPTQSVREGKPGSLAGAVIGNVDALYSYYTGGRDFQYDLSHPSMTTNYYNNQFKQWSGRAIFETRRGIQAWSRYGYR